MPSAHVALRSAIHDALVADTALAAALGGSHVYDEPPRNAAFPYVTLGEARIVDASADGGPVQEHQLTLHAWSREFALFHRRHQARIRRAHLSRAGAVPRRHRTRHLKEQPMGAQKGKDLLVKIDGGAGFVTVAGLRSRRIAFNAELVDITHAESADRWRELLAGAGVKRASISGRGLFKDASSDALVRQAFFDGAVNHAQVIVPDFGTIEGLFQISSLEFAGEHNGEVTFDLALESAGALTFTAG
jgi:TP901-1 family phage major tail protein